MVAQAPIAREQAPTTAMPTLYTCSSTLPTEVVCVLVLFLVADLILSPRFMFVVVDASLFCFNF
jgi:hypothetical protein